MQKRLNKKNNNKFFTVLLILIFLILLFILLFTINFHEINRNTDQQKASTPDTLSQTDTLLKKDSVGKDTVTKKDTFLEIPPKPKKQEKKGTLKKEEDTTQRDTSKDSTQADTLASQQPKDSVDTSKIEPVDPCKSDTLEPWVYPDPSGGLHRKLLQVYFVSNKPLAIEWKFKDENDWKKYTGSPIKIESTKTLEFTARDSCGKQMSSRSEYYEIERKESSQYCPEGMEYIKVGTNRFCIDRYEWPNKKKSVPVSYISKYGASDSCYSVEKRLCTSDEWMLACMGPYSWKYPYGQVYEPYACSTHDTSVIASGSKPECRSFFGVYDMSGGLAEWTDTRAVENRQFYYVKGGFWESGPQSSCFEKRYSYYPQNRHNPVGFRCCKDVFEPGQK